MTEQPRYSIVRTLAEDIEIRDYKPYLAATTLVEGDRDHATNNGFKVLAGFIQGGNDQQKRIEMTAPVTLDDTLPGNNDADLLLADSSRTPLAESTDGHVMTFMMPHEYTMDELPTPTDPRVKIVEVPARRIASIKYSGRWTEELYEKKLETLRSALQKAGITERSNPAWARYNSPMMPFFLRHNEIWLEVADAAKA